MKSKKNFMGKKRLERNARPDPAELERQREEFYRDIRRLNVEVDSLVASGEWNRSHYERILKEAKSLPLQLGDSLYFLYEHAEPEWLE